MNTENVKKEEELEQVSAVEETTAPQEETTPSQEPQTDTQAPEAEAAQEAGEETVQAQGEAEQTQGEETVAETAVEVAERAANEAAAVASAAIDAARAASEAAKKAVAAAKAAKKATSEEEAQKAAETAKAAAQTAAQAADSVGAKKEALEKEVEQSAQAEENAKKEEQITFENETSKSYQYTLTYDEVFISMMTVYRLKVGKQDFMNVFFYSIIMIIALFLGVQGDLFCLGLAGITGFLIYRKLTHTKKASHRFAEEAAKQNIQNTLTVYETGCEINDTVNQVRMRYRACEMINEQNNLILIHRENVYTIPKHCFGEERQEAVNYFKAALGKRFQTPLNKEQKAQMDEQYKKAKAEEKAKKKEKKK